MTHPHGDHIGGAKILIRPNKKELAEFPYLKNISVGAVYDNGVVYTSGVYRNYVKAVEDKGIPYQHLKSGNDLDFGGGVKFKVLFPTSEFVATANSGQIDKEDRTYNLNNGSIVGKLTYKNFSMLFTGDCEKESEAAIVANNGAADLKCDVLKAGHHGWATSSTKNFLAAVNPSVVLISAGHKDKNNIGKGAPHREVAENFLAQGVQAKNIYATRFNGIITIISDGKNFTVQPETNLDWTNDWIAKKIQNQQK